MKEKAWVLGGKLIFRFGGRGKPPCGPYIVFDNPDNVFFMCITCLRVVPSMYHKRSMLCKNWFTQVGIFPVWIIIHVVLLLKSANWGMVFHCLLMPPFIHSFPAG